ncbi:hypothetical protein FisN_5Lh175 [Fistulifera solaris]|uniref:Uncharacterized protein n=1 Tax=Fistulifera solaris TaxID=1519565 RepID=A0A1Z5JIU6_FISSO|nr:hypothetical protein FisN_5Lh175 [Fistulifera solaris]|eukprot:GAX13923.1 hypothetical protein FisN_5Lh175 [Fistulifera solaris]
MKSNWKSNRKKRGFFCWCSAKSQPKLPPSEFLLQKTPKSYAYATSPISTTQDSDDDDERASLLDHSYDDVLPNGNNSKTKETSDSSVSPKTPPRLSWKEKLVQSIERRKKLGWNTQRGYRQVDDTLPEDVLPDAISKEKDVSPDFLPHTQQDTRLTLSSISTGSALLNFSLSAEYPQFELADLDAETMTGKVIKTGKRRPKEKEKFAATTKGSLSEPYPLLHSKRRSPDCEASTTSTLHTSTCNEDSTPWKKIESWVESHSIQKPKPIIVRRQPLYSADEAEDEELSFANSESTLFTTSETH